MEVTSLTIDLFAPGMGPLHRAGLGGLAATIKRLGLTESDGFVFDDRSVTLSWSKSATAATFFEDLYKKAFAIRDGMIHLPGSYGRVEPPIESCPAVIAKV